MSRKSPKATPVDAAAAAAAAEADAALTQKTAERESLFDAQAALGRERRMQKAARKDPAVAEILDQNRAQQVVIDELRAQLAAAESARDEALAQLAAK